jgi:hypothetical protein
MNERERQLQAAMKLNAAAHRMQAARFDLAAASVETGAAFRRMAELIQQGYDNEIYAHPDLMYLDVQLDGYYG